MGLFGNTKIAQVSALVLEEQKYLGMLGPNIETDANTDIKELKEDLKQFGEEMLAADPKGRQSILKKFVDSHGFIMKQKLTEDIVDHLLAIYEKLVDLYQELPERKRKKVRALAWFPTG